MESFRTEIVRVIAQRCRESVQAEVAQGHADELLAAHDALDSAIESATVAQRQAEVAIRKANRLDDARAALKDLRATRDNWLRDAEQAREAQRAAEGAAQEQAVELATLRGENAGLQASLQAGEAKPNG